MLNGNRGGVARILTWFNLGEDASNGSVQRAASLRTESVRVVRVPHRPDMLPFPNRDRICQTPKDRMSLVRNGVG